MSDFATTFATGAAPPPFLSNWSGYGPIQECVAASGAAVGASTVTWTTANQARFYPIQIPFAYPVNRVWWVNGSTLGNADFGIYTTDGERLYSTGSTAQSGSAVPQYVTPSGAPLWLPPGVYYFGMNFSGTTNAVFGNALAAEYQRFAGIQQQAVGALALPDPATFGVANTASINLCGITWTNTGFG